MSDAALHDHDANPGVEPEGVPFAPIFATFFVSVIVVAVLVIAGFEIAQREFMRAEVMAAETTGYPLLRETRAAADAKLNGYEAIDAAAGIYRIPIEEAVDAVIEETPVARPVTDAIRLTR